jgi:MinD superfamily P-loop ATPase
MTCQRGILNVGEVIAVPIIKQLLKGLDNNLNIIDSSPGTSCNVVTTLSFADSAILVTEPTEFGLHDLKRAISITEEMNIPFGVVINKVTDKDNMIQKYCEEKNINILGIIKYDRKIAELYSKGILLLKYNNIFNNIILNIKRDLIWK